MKHNFVAVVCLFFSIDSYSQTLKQGVFTEVVLETCHYAGIPTQNCPDYELQFFRNCFPYASGMNLYIRVDSIIGITDSIIVNRFPDYSNVVFKANDTIRVTYGNFNYPVGFNYFGNDHLYASLVAIGTPLVSGEPYYCNYSSVGSIRVDGCASTVILNWFSGGNGALDSVKLCNVLPSVGIEKLDNYTGLLIGPNPFKDRTIIKMPTNLTNGEIVIYNYQGVEVSRIFNIVGDEHVLQRENLVAGLYFLRLSQNNELISFCRLLVMD